jgi:SAM-dependent methyltransferase
MPKESLVPPVELIVANNVGVHDKENILKEYARVGKYIATVLKNRADLKPTDSVLDMGCGSGRVAMHLTEYLDGGTYYGVDIVKSSIEWCRDAYREFPNFHFIHADLHSKFYNPEGKSNSENYRFPFDDGALDVIWSSSLFTHMLIAGVDNYLKEMARTHRVGGRIWNSYLLLDEISEPLVHGAPRKDGRRMEHKVDGGRIAYPDKPEWVVGLHKDRILALHEKHGFDVIKVELTNWSGGRPEVPTGQDVIVARKR